MLAAVVSEADFVAEPGTAMEVDGAISVSTAILTPTTQADVEAEGGRKRAANDEAKPRKRIRFADE